jgi:putative ABC transport system permease protein
VLLIRIVRMSVKSLWDYRRRTFLSLLGILISSLMIVFLLSVLYNFKNSLLGQIQGIGANQIIAVPGRLPNHKAIDAGLGDMLSFATFASTLTYADALDVQKKVAGVSAVAPQAETVATLRSGSQHTEAILTGTTPGFAAIFSPEMEAGRWFSEQETEEKARVVVLGHLVKESLFGEEDAVGRSVSIQGKMYTVIGVLATKEMIGFHFDDRAYSGYPLVSDTFHLQNASMISFQAASREQLPDVEKQIDRVITHNHGTKDFGLLKADKELHLIDVILSLVTAITLGITGVSFLVGGDGDHECHATLGEGTNEGDRPAQSDRRKTLPDSGAVFAGGALHQPVGQWVRLYCRVRAFASAYHIFSRHECADSVAYAGDRRDLFGADRTLFRNPAGDPCPAHPADGCLAI